jgi:alkanesulfonate monooxygenase SsuD/methylene tetrahydromethanopterin reductase-like flavin-dependent oxidoreductase (luciferase family)
MKFGVQVNCYGVTWDKIRTSIETMEVGRWNSLWFADHFFPPWGGPKGHRESEHLPAFEGYTLIAVAAGMTSKLQLGHLVLGNTYRNPALLAKMATTLDQASQGRFTLSLGAAWCEREHYGFGWKFPTMRERSDRFEEACQLIRTLFTTEGPIDFRGRYYWADQLQMSPGCYQKPHIPILVGGTGERRTLRTLAKYGDVLNLDGWAGQGVALETYRHKVEVLERHCERAGRDPAEIRRTILMPIVVGDDQAARDAGARLVKGLGAGTMVGTRQQVVDRIGALIDEGVDEIMFGNIPTGGVEEIQRIEQEIVAAFD